MYFFCEIRPSCVSLIHIWEQTFLVVSFMNLNYCRSRFQLLRMIRVWLLTNKKSKAYPNLALSSARMLDTQFPTKKPIYTLIYSPHTLSRATSSSSPGPSSPCTPPPAAWSPPSGGPPRLRGRQGGRGQDASSKRTLRGPQQS